jgi:hypothetical protein
MKYVTRFTLTALLLQLSSAVIRVDLTWKDHEHVDKRKARILQDTFYEETEIHGVLNNLGWVANTLSFYMLF